MYAKIIQSTLKYGKQGFDKAKSFFKKDNKNSSPKKENKNDKQEKVDINEAEKKPYDGLSEGNERTDGKKWGEVVEDERASVKPANEGTEKGYLKGLGGLNSAPTSTITQDGNGKKTLQEIIEERETSKLQKKEKLDSEQKKTYEERAEERREKVEAEKSERRDDANRNWQEKENYRRGRIETQDQSDPDNTQQFSTIEEEASSIQNLQIDLLKSNSSSYFVPEYNSQASAFNVNNENQKESLGLLREDSQNTPQVIIDEWNLRKGSPINGQEYYQVMEEKEYSPPPMDMDLDGGEDGGDDGGSDGGSDGGGDGGGD